MDGLDEHSIGQDSDISSELEELHRGGLRVTLLGLSALAIYTNFILTYFDNRVDPLRFEFMIAVVLTTAVAFWALRFGATTSVLILALGLFCGIAAILPVVHDDRVIFWFAAPVILVGAVAGWRFGVVCAAAASAIAIVDGPMLGIIASRAVVEETPFLWVCLLLSWWLGYPTRTALAWSWHSYIRSIKVMDELRVSRGQLQATVDSLNLAYLRLEQLNLDLARAKRAADEARRLKSEFAAAISHELRTPLNLIIGFSEIMVNTPEVYGGLLLPAPCRDDLEAIYRNACHLSNLVDDVLDLSQIEADRLGLRKEAVRLAPVVDEAVTTIARLYQAKGLSLTVDVPLDLPPIDLDRTRIRQVLINILNNAVRCTAEGGVKVSASVGSPHIWVKR